MVSKNTADALEGVGARMRALREERAMSLRALARLIDVTPSLISQIETGKINPSVSSLYAIANALDVPMDVFFGRKAPTTSSSPAGRRLPTSADELNNRPVLDPDAAPPRQEPVSGEEPASTVTPLVHPADRDKIVIDGFGGFLTWERLTRTAEPAVDFLEICYEPGASSAKNLIMHSGREYGYVLSGELTLDLGFETHEMRPGDSICFDSATPHRLANRGVFPVRAIWVVINRVPQRESGGQKD